MDIALDILQKECPEFAWRVDQLDARDYMLAQSRNRVFLQGVRALDRQVCLFWLEGFCILSSEDWRSYKMECLRRWNSLVEARSGTC